MQWTSTIRLQVVTIQLQTHFHQLSPNCGTLSWICADSRIDDLWAKRAGSFFFASGPPLMGERFRLFRVDSSWPPYSPTRKTFSTEFAIAVARGNDARSILDRRQNLRVPDDRNANPYAFLLTFVLVCLFESRRSLLLFVLVKHFVRIRKIHTPWQRQKICYF